MHLSLEKINKNARRRITTMLNGQKRASPVPHLLKTNDPPSDAEIVLVQEALLKAEEDLQVIQGDVAMEKNLNKFIRTHRAVISLVRRLPDDIWATIFEELSFSPRPYYSHPPWSASQVCRSWRNLALSLPGLWRCIDLLLNNERQKTHSFLTFLTRQLDRSHPVPLNVFVRCSSYAYDYVHHPFIDILMEYSERWGAIDFEVPGHPLMAFASVRGRLPVLHAASLEILSAGPYEDGAVPLNTFEYAPALREVHILGSATSIDLRLPWWQLDTYEDKSNNRAGLINLLNSSESQSPLKREIKHLSLKHAPPFTDLVPLPTVTLDALERFSINYYSASRARRELIPETYIAGLTLSNLRELRFTNYLTDSNIAPLTALITRSRCNHLLTSLEFAPGSNFKAGELTDVLRLTPQLANLVCYVPEPQDLADLAGSAETIIPLLHNLVLHAPTVLRRDQSREIGALAKARCEPQGGRAQPRMSFRVVLYTTEFWHDQHEDLEMAFAPPEVAHLARKKTVDDAVNEMKKAVDELYMHIALADDNMFASPRDSVKRYLYKRSRDTEPARVQYALDIVEDVRFDSSWEFHDAGLHHLVYHLAHSFSSSSSQERALKLLERWNEEHVYPSLEHRHWAFQGLHSFVFIPSDHDSRQLYPSALKIVYGKRFFHGKYGTHKEHTLIPSNLEYKD